MIPMGGHKVSCNPWLVSNYPDSYLSMGLTAERLAQKYGITREMSDEFSYQSHQKALRAIAAGNFDDECVPVNVRFTAPVATATRGSAAVKLATQEIVFKVDEGPRADTTLEALAALKPAFHAKGTVTAGNSSQMSDGAAAAVVMSADEQNVGHQAAGAIRGLRNGGMSAGRDGNRTGVCDSEGAETCGIEARATSTSSS